MGSHWICEGGGAYSRGHSSVLFGFERLFGSQMKSVRTFNFTSSVRLSVRPSNCLFVCYAIASKTMQEIFKILHGARYG